MKTVVPAATRRAMYDRAIAAQTAMDRWVEYLATISSEQTPPEERRRPVWLGRKKPDFITIPYKEFELLLHDLSRHAEEIRKLRKPIIQRSN